VLDAAFQENKIVVRLGVELPAVGAMPGREGVAGRAREASRLGFFVRQLGGGRGGEERSEID
jgi:hypothetical protein